MSYWRWIKSKWREFTEWLLIGHGWEVGTIHPIRVSDTMFFRQGDIYRVADEDDQFIILHVMATEVIICAKVNRLGYLILRGRELNYKLQRWRDGL